MLNVTEEIGFGSNKVIPTVAYTDSASSTADATTYTFTAAAIGTAGPDRFVVVGIFGSKASALNISTVTIGGISATLLAVSTLDPNRNLSFFGAFVPTGTTADVVVTFDTSAVRAAIGVWQITNLWRPLAGAVESAAVQTDNGAMNLGVGSDCVILAIGSSATTVSCTWTGVTENFDLAAFETQNFSGGSFLTTVPETSRTVSADWSGSPTSLHAFAIFLR